MEQLPQEDVERQSLHTKGCLGCGCFGCRDKIRQTFEEERQRIAQIPLRVMLASLTWKFLIILALVLSIVALSKSGHVESDSDLAGDEFIKSDVDAFRSLNATHAVISLSNDTRERAIQMWNLHNMHILLDVNPAPAGKVPEVPDNEIYSG